MMDTKDIIVVDAKGVDEKSLVPLDSKAAGMLDSVVSGLTKEIAALEAARPIRDILGSGAYKVILPEGLELTKAKDFPGGFRAIAREGGKIRAQAVLYEMDSAVKVAESALIFQTAMNAAAFVVGQYYMAQIDSKLEKIFDGVTDVIDFLESEYKSKIMAIIASIQKSSAFRQDILLSDKKCEEEIAHLRTLEYDCAQLLGHANVMIEELIAKQPKDFEEYSDILSKLSRYIPYQQVLLDASGAIADLIYALHKGLVSPEEAKALYSMYYDGVRRVNRKLMKWHIDELDNLGIKLRDEKLRRNGVNALLHAPIGIFKKEANYKKLPKETRDEIESQIGIFFKPKDPNPIRVYEEQPVLVYKEGVWYYEPK